MHWEKVKEVPTAQRWNPYYQARGADIEMTAYALMTYTLLAETDSSLIGQAMPIVKWLTKQRNALGGFASTQVLGYLHKDDIHENEFAIRPQLTLNDWSRGKQFILFPENLNVSRGTSH